MSNNNQPLSGNSIIPIQRTSLNSLLTNLILDSDSGNSSLLVQTGSITSFYIDKYANVGINTTSPGAQLEISSANGSCLRLRYGTSTTSYSNIFMNSNGNLSINPNTSGSEINTTASLNLANHNGSTVGLKLGGTLVTATAAQLNYNTVTPGTASASKALVLDSSSAISGISSLSATSLTGTLQTAAQPNITSVGTLSTLTISGNLTVNGSFTLSGGGNVATILSYLDGITPGTVTASKGLVVDSNKDISTIRNLGVTSITIGSSTLSSTESAYLSGVTAGTAANSKVLVLNSSGSISGITSLSATNLTGTLQTAAQPNITSIGTLTTLSIGSNTLGATESAYLSGVTAGTAANSKVLVLNSSGSISGITSLSATNLTGTLTSGPQTGITSVGTLSSLSVSGSTSITNTTDASSYTAGGALTVSGGLAIAKNVYIGSSLTIGGNLFVNGTSTVVNSTSISIQDNTLILNSSPSGSNDSGILINRYQTANDTSAGTVITDAPYLTTTVNSATSTTVTLTAGSSVDNYYNNWWIKAGTQIRQVQSYVGSTKTITLVTAFTLTPSIGSTIGLYNRSYVSFVWNEANKYLYAAYTANDSSSTLTILEDVDLRAGTIYTSGKVITSDNTDSSSISTGSIITSGGIGVTKTLHVGTGIYGTIQTASQPNITSLGTLGSLTVTNGITASTLTGTLQTATQTNITSVGTLTSLAISSNSANALTLTNSSASGIANLKLISDTYSLEFGVRGTTAGTNPSTAYLYYNGAYQMLMDTSGNIAIGTSTFGYKLNVNGSINATSFNVGGATLATTLISGSITAGTASPGKVLSVDSSSNVSGIGTLTATTLVGTIQTASQPNITSLGSLTSLTVGSSTVSGTEIGYLSGVTAGAASASKALVIDSNKDITGIRKISVSGTSNGISLSNSSTSINTNIIFNSDTYSAEIGTIGSTAITNPNTFYIYYNGAYRLLSNSSGEFSLGTNNFGYRLNINGSLNATNYYLNGALLEMSSVAYTSGLTPGTASASKALVVDTSTNITGINSIGTTTITIGSTTLSGTQAGYLTSITPGTAANSKALVLDSSGNISGINSLSTTSLIVNGNDVSSSISSSAYITSVTPGTATASKALIVDSSKNIAGINSLGTTTLVLGGTSLTSTEASYLSGITAGTAANSKALILNSSGTISGISSLGTTTLVLGGTSLGSTEAGYLSSITAGTAANSKALILNSSGTISGISSLGTTTLVLGGTSLGSSEAGYLSSITAGTVSASKAVVVDSNKYIAGFQGIGIQNGTATSTIMINALDNSMILGDLRYLRFGRSGNDRESAELSFYYDTTVANCAFNIGFPTVGRRMTILAGGNVGIGTTSPGYKLDVNGSINATSYYLSGSALDFSGLPYVTGITAGTATNSKALVLDNSGAISGITSLNTTTLVLGSTSLGSTEAGYLSSITAGTASASKALVVDANKDITGIRKISCSGSTNGLTLTNTATTSNASLTLVSDTYSAQIGVTGSAASTSNVFFISYNAASRLLIDSTGAVSIGTSTFGYKLNVNGSINATSYYLSGSALDFSGLSYITGITAGTAANSKALVLDGSGTISGITSLSATTVVINGSSISSEAAFIAGVTAGTAANSKALVLNSSGAISGITSLGTTTLVLGGTSLGATEAGYLSSNTAGTAVASKAVVLDGTKNISGINQLTLTTLTLGSTSLTTTQAAYLTSITPGTASASKALVLDSSSNIANINSIGLIANGNSITMTNLTTTARTTIRFTNDVKSFELGTACSANTTYPTNSFYLYDVTSSAIRFMVDASGNVAIGSSTVSDKLYVNGTINATSYKIGGTAADLTLLTGITAGTASAGKVLTTDASNNLSGLNTLGITSSSSIMMTAFNASLTSTSLVTFRMGRSSSDRECAELSYLYNSTLDSSAFNIGFTSVGRRMTVLAGGNVGIGNTSPAYKLDVNGNINYTGNLYSSGTLVDFSLISGITAGTVTASKALIVDSSSNLTGLNNLIMNGASGTGTSNYSISANSILLALNNKNYANTDQARALSIDASTFTDTATAASGSSALTPSYVFIDNPTYASTNTSVTIPNAYTCYIDGAPIAGTNTTITNSYPLYVNASNSYFNGYVTFGGNIPNTVRITNTTASSVANILFTNDNRSLELGFRGSNTGTGPTNGFYIYDNSSSSYRFVITSGGTVGIATGNPSSSYKLDVNGQIHSNSYINADTAFYCNQTSTSAASIILNTSGSYLFGFVPDSITNTMGCQLLSPSTYATGNGYANLKVATLYGANICAGTSTDNSRLISALDGVTTVGSFRYITLGSTNSTGNQGEIRFCYKGSNNNLNYLGMGFFANSDILCVRNNGCIGINTTTPINALDINGYMTVQGAGINMGSGISAQLDITGSSSYLDLTIYNRVLRCRGSNASPVQFEIQCHNGASTTSTNSSCIGTITNNDLKLMTNDTTRMTISANGNISCPSTITSGSEVVAAAFRPNGSGQPDTDAINGFYFGVFTVPSSATQSTQVTVTHNFGSTNYRFVCYCNKNTTGNSDNFSWCVASKLSDTIVIQISRADSTNGWGNAYGWEYMIFGVIS